MIHEDALPGYESKLSPKPEWQPRYAGSGRLAGKVAIITGADSGIGRAAAALYAREGANIAIAYLSEDHDAAETKRIVETEGRKAITLRGNIGKPEFSDEIVAATLKTFGTIDMVYSVVRLPSHDLVPVCAKGDGLHDAKGQPTGIRAGVHYMRVAGPRSPALDRHRHADDAVRRILVNPTRG